MIFWNLHYIRPLAIFQNQKAPTNSAEEPIIEIEPNKELPVHFFIHKGEEMGYVLSGKLRMTLNMASYTVRAGDVIYLTTEMPSQWKNPGPNVARLLWIKAK
ncbi:MAG TPA: cupin domain-containing protein [Proteobacteria bacterium]|nr:cupin domain-containing protein [Pseudomonadota bacterium]